MIEELRSLDWLMMGDEAARPRCAQASKQTVSSAPRMMLAVTGSISALVVSGSRFAASFRFNSNDIMEFPFHWSCRAAHCVHGFFRFDMPMRPSGGQDMS